MKTATNLPSSGVAHAAPASKTVRPAESLGYVCKATVQRHGKKGVVYRNRWATGAQDLIFHTHERAKQWADSHLSLAGAICTYTGPANQ